MSKSAGILNNKQLMKSNNILLFITVILRHSNGRIVLLTCGILWDTFSAGDTNSDWPSYPSARHKADSH